MKQPLWDVANDVTGKISKRYNNVEYYFQLKKTNESLVQENVMLRNLLKQDFEVADTSASTQNGFHSLRYHRASP